MQNRRVVITGAGGVNPLGFNLPGLNCPPGSDDFVASAREGKVGLKPISWDHSKLNMHVLGEPQVMTDAFVRAALGKRAAKCVSWANNTTRQSIIAAKAAALEAKIVDTAGNLLINAKRASVHTAADVEEHPAQLLQHATATALWEVLIRPEVSSALIPLWPLALMGDAEAVKRVKEVMAQFFTPQELILALLEVMGTPNVMFRSVGCASALALNKMLGFRGPWLNITNACASSVAAMETAFDRICLGKSDVAMTGASWARTGPHSLFGLLAWIYVVSPGSEPDCCRPFDRDRNGIVPAAGGAMFVFEELQHALQRGATILAEVCGFGGATEPNGLIEPDEAAFTDAIVEAMEAAAIRPEQVAFISSHATGTKAGDVVEARVIQNLFGDETQRIPVTALKGIAGHSILASTACEMLAMLRCGIGENLACPNATLRNQDPECSLLLPRQAMELDRNRHYFLAFGAGFGGEERVIVLRRPIF